MSDNCIAAHPDMAVAMAALDARVETIAADGATRTIPIDALYRPPGNTPNIERVLVPGELIRSVVHRLRLPEMARRPNVLCRYGWS